MNKIIKDLKYGGKMYIILMYDIKQIGDFNKVQRRVYQICKKYLFHVQNSVFEGELSESQLIKLKFELKKYLRKKDDSCIIFKSRNERWLQKEFITEIIDEDKQFI